MSRLARVPPPLALGLLLLAAFAPLLAYTQTFVSYTVMPDELTYVKEAGHIAETLRPVLPGEAWWNSYSQLAPLLLALPYGLLDATTAFDVAHALQAAVMVSAAIPTYLLARRVAEPPVAGLLAAALVVAVPWVTMTGTLLTEPVAYATAAWSYWACQRAIADPSPLRDAAALGALALVFLSRTQLVVLAFAFVVAIVVFELLRTRSVLAGVRAAVSRHPVIVAAIAVALLVTLVVGGDEVLGNYIQPLQGDWLPAGMGERTVETLAFAAVAVAALPLALSLAWLACVLGRRTSTDDEAAFAALLLVSGPALVLSVGSFLVRYAPGVKDRYLCYLAPLLAVGMVAALFSRRTSSWAILAGGAATAALLWAADLAQEGPTLDSPAQGFNVVLNGRGGQIGLDGSELAAVLVFAGAALLALARRLRGGVAVAIVASLAVAVAAAGQTAYLARDVVRGQERASAEFTAGRGWLDRETPGTGGIALLLGQIEPYDISDSVPRWWDVSFFAERADRAYIPQDGFEYDHRPQRVRIDERTGVFDDAQEREHVVRSAEERRFALVGERIVAERDGIVVSRPARPLRAAWRLTGATDAGVIAPGAAGVLTVFEQGSERLRLVLEGSPELPAEGRVVRVDGARAVRVRPGDTATITRGLSRRVRIAVSGPAAPEGAGVRVRTVDVSG
jgi:hypothetical protein